MDYKEQLYEWLEELSRWMKVDDFVDVKQERDLLRIKIYTRSNQYSITAHSDYLGCTVVTRKPRAGETWNRGNDLPDGKFCRETWDRIKNAIVAYELVKVAKRQRGWLQEPVLSQITPTVSTLGADDRGVGARRVADERPCRLSY
jgi:hypothetical protein